MMNVSLLCKWWWKLEHEEGIWQDIVRQKYMKNTCVFQVRHKSSNSLVWNDLIKVKNIYIKGRVLILGDGNNIDF